MRRVDERPPLDVAEPTAGASPATTAAALAPTDHLETRLKKLKTMYDKGLITKDDYEKKKAELLKSF